MQVIGMGESKTPQPFISACNQFKYLDKLYEKAKQESEAVPPVLDSGLTEEQKKKIELEKVSLTIRSIIENHSDDEGWIFSGKLGDLLSRRLPDFDARNYGYSKLTSFMNSLGDFEVKKLTLGNHQKQIYFRNKEEEVKPRETPKKSSRRGGRRGSKKSGGKKG